MTAASNESRGRPRTRSPTRRSPSYSVEPLLGGSTKRSGMHPDPVTAPSLQLRLHARPESAFLLRQRLCLWLYELGATDDEIFDVALASTEAFANAIEHPRQPCADAIEVDGSL